MQQPQLCYHLVPPDFVYSVGHFRPGSFRFVHEDLGALLAPVGHRREKFPPIGREKAGSRACWYGVACKPVIMIPILLLQDINETLTANNVNAAPIGVVEKVVGISDSFWGR